MSERISGVRIPLPPLFFVDNNSLICFNLDVDDSFATYKDKIGTRITTIIGEGLLQLKVTEDEAEQMGKYILDNIDQTKTNSELLDFVTNLSVKWPIFNSILTSDSQTVPSAPFPTQTQEKTDEIVHTAEDLVKENKIDEALQVAKAATDNTSQNVGGNT